MLSGDKFAAVVLETMNDGVYAVDRDRRITYWSPGAERLTGHLAADVVGRRCRDGILNHVDANGRLLCFTACPLAATIEDGERREVHAYLHHKGGHRVPVAIRAAPLRDEAGDRILGAVEVFNDDTSCSRLGEQLSQAEKDAFTDPLTGLPNRRLVTQRLASAHESFRRAGVPVAVLFVDVDHFKHVNDRFGHAAGDEILRMVGGTLGACTRGADLVGRWGGEEFLVVVTAAEPSLVGMMADRLRTMVAKSWIEVDGRRVRVTVSVGAAVASTGEAVDELVDRADRAMLEAKEQGRNRFVLATPWPDGALLADTP